MRQLVVDGSKLNVVFDPHEFQLADADREKMLQGLESLARQAARFPLADLRVYIEFNRHKQDYAVKLALILPSNRLAVEEHGAQIQPAFEHCVAVLHEQLTALTSQMEGHAQRQRQEKGTVMHVEPASLPDGEQIRAAAEEGDYAAFRVATLPYEEAVRKRAGRWVERYPRVDASIGKGLEINDIVEAVFLSAFERFGSRPMDVRFGDWLEGLIDPAVKAILKDPDAELENISLARSALEAQGGPTTV